MDVGQDQIQMQSFEVAEGDSFGDLLSAQYARKGRKLKVGLFAGAYFEFWRMYSKLRAQVESDCQIVLDRLSENDNLEIVYPGMVDTIDGAESAGRYFRSEQIDLLVLAYRTYVPDVYVHRLLANLKEVPLLMFASQSREKFDYSDDYCGVLRNSGVMALVQLVAGFRKMGAYPTLEVVVGSIHDDAAYDQIGRYAEVVSVHQELRSMTVGVIGNVFRGMYDFEFDKTKVAGALGPEVLNIQIDHLEKCWNQVGPHGEEVEALIDRANDLYVVDNVGDEDLRKASRLSVALQDLIDRFRLDGLVLLSQHFIEAKLKTSPNFALTELHRDQKFPAVVEGDVIGLVMMKIMGRLTGMVPLFLEWSEFDLEHNAWMLLGHGFGDPGMANPKYPVKLTPCAENWGLEGTGCSAEFAPASGPCTLAHFIEDTKGWRMVISSGEFLNMPPLPIRDVHAMVKVDRPIKEYTESLTKAGVPHHAITSIGDIRKELSQLADLMGIEKDYI